MSSRQYDNESISSLKGADRVRLRPGVIFGSDGIEGCKHSFFEILSNSIDEAREGYGSLIEVTRYKDHSIKVRDYGRGIPLEYNEGEKRYNWELIFCELYAGGKYKNNDGLNYEYSLGLNGLGACATQYSSEYMDVLVTRDGYDYELHFKKGENEGGLKKTPTSSNVTGTTITWRPDLDVFTDINIPIEYLCDIIKKQAVVNSGIKFVLYDCETDKEFSYCYEDGIVDYVKEKAEDKNFSSIQYIKTQTRGRDRKDKPEYKLKMEIAFCFSNNLSCVEYYHNSSFLEHGGAPDKAIKAAFVYEIDKFLKESGKYNKDESKITYNDVYDSLILVTNSFSTQTSYENQTKKSITNKFIQEAMTDFVKEELEIYFIENKLESDRILEQILVNKRSRESAEKTRVNIKKKLSGNIDIANRVKKFVNCRSKDVEKRELYIVEGDSALGSCKLGRNAEFQAIMAVRGKILNCLKADIDAIFKSDVIVDLLRVLGCGVEIKSKNNKEFNNFNLDNLKWSKVIICTDADVDGFQIRTLILAMFYKVMPTLLQEGRVYIAESPLFEITTKDKIMFAYTEYEKTTMLSNIKGKYTLQRSKGLGENEPQMMWETTMNPKTRRLIKVIPDDVFNTEYYFDLLLGENLAGRKTFIEENGYKYLDNIDVS